jgi:SAM-dependent methyltransferase
MISKHYDDRYFGWQAPIGEFGGWANQSKFLKYICSTDTVLDFGCGGGFLLNGIKCGKKLGTDVNPWAVELAKKNGIEIFINAEDVPDKSVDVVISNHALEHTLHPLNELKVLYKKLKVGGKIIFVVPCESIFISYKRDDISNHLYSWSPMSIGNLFTEAGFLVIESKSYLHKWPPKFKLIARFSGRKMFDIICRFYGNFSRSLSQVRVVAMKKNE